MDLLVVLTMIFFCRGAEPLRLGSPDSRTPPGGAFAAPFERRFEQRCPRTGVTTLPVPDRCDVHFACAEGVKTIKECPVGLLYDPHHAHDAEPCDLPANVKVSRLLQCSPQLAAFIPFPPCPAEGVTSIHVCGSTETFFLCTEGELEYKKCLPGRHYDFDYPNNTYPCSITYPSESQFQCEAEPPALSPPPCPAEGVTSIPHHYRCEAYYECVEGVQSFKECPEGLLYNPDRASDTEPCDLPSNLELSKIFTCSAQVPALLPCPALGETTPDTGRCHKYYKCELGTLHLKQCPAGMLYNPARATDASPCDLPFDVEVSRLLQCSSQLPEQIMTQATEDRCDAYYKCAKGGCETVRCPAGLLYNPEHANDAEPCVDPLSLADSLRSECSKDRPACILCPAEGAMTTRHAALGTCHGYLACLQGVPSYRQCPAGLMYSPDRADTAEPCVLPSSLKVSRLLDCSPKIHDLLPCSSENVSSVPNSDRCDAYYNCWEGSREVIDCPEGQLYNPDHASDEFSACGLPSNVEKYRLLRCSPEINERVMTHSIEGHCDIYYQCVRGECEVIKCPAALLYNRYREKDTEPCVHTIELEYFDDCRPEETLQFGPPPPCPAEGVTTLPAPNRCEAYRECVDGTEGSKECPVGLIYNPARANDTEPCDPPSSIVVSTLLECNRDLFTELLPESPTCPWEVIHLTTLLAPRRCDAYYECIRGGRTFKKCPAGLLYNPDRANNTEPCTHLLDLPLDRFLKCSPHVTDFHCRMFAHETAPIVEAPGEEEVYEATDQQEQRHW